MSLNSYYQNAIQFNLLGNDFIDNDYYYISFDQTKAGQLFNVNSHCNAIDIYILGQSTSWGYAGMAQNIPSKAYIVHGSYYNTSTLPHEMGHCLGLYHTHHGTVNEGGGDINQCAELVNGSNASTYGDYITDTPADPNVWSPNSCSYIGTGHDANGQAYHPSASNLMTYAYKPCRTIFSSLQIVRIHDFINNTQILQNTLFSAISGNPLICSTGTFTVNDSPLGSTFLWKASSNLTLPSNTNVNSIIVTANGNGSGWLQAIITTPCRIDTLPKYSVWIGPPVVTVSGPVDGCLNNTYYYTADPTSGYSNASNYTWDLVPLFDNRLSPYGYQNHQCAITFYNHYSASGYDVKARAQNSCGVGGYSTLTSWIHTCYTFMLSPNPASEIVTVTKQVSGTDASFSSASLADDATTVYTVRIIDFYGALQYATRKSGDSFALPIGSFKDGSYFVQITNGKDFYNLPLIVKH